MMNNKKAIILDLDNTIYPVAAIGAEVFEPLIKMIKGQGFAEELMAEIESELRRKPFQLVAKKFGFPVRFTNECILLLATMTYDRPIMPYPDYSLIRVLPVSKYLVTSGFKKLQWSKIEQLGIADDFEEIHIVDTLTSDATKKSVFADICSRKGFKIGEVLVIGDDPESEIKAAKELGLDYVLYDKIGVSREVGDPNRIEDYGEMVLFSTSRTPIL